MRAPDLGAVSGARKTLNIMWRSGSEDSSQALWLLTPVQLSILLIHWAGFRQELWRKFGAASLKDWLYPPEGLAAFEAWDPENLLTLARMWQAGDIGDVGGNGDYREALGGLRRECWLCQRKPTNISHLKMGERRSSI